MVNQAAAGTARDIPIGAAVFIDAASVIIAAAGAHAAFVAHAPGVLVGFVGFATGQQGSRAEQ